jgi:hypothetical protein
MAKISAAALCLPALAHASEQLPLPPATETFKSHQACLAALKDDSYGAAARKIRASTGLSSRHWADSDEEAAGYLQSDDVSCKRNKSCTIYVWFKNGRAESVSASKFPAF